MRIPKVKPGTFIDMFLTHMNNMETAVEYDLFGALWLLSLACQRDIYVDRPTLPVYMNLYTIFVADSGITRKSTAVTQVAKIANDFLENEPQLMLLEGKTTPEKLDEILHQSTGTHGTGRVAIAISELAVFLGLERYTNTMPILLTDLFDSPSTRKAGGSLTRGEVTQRNLFVSFLSASTPSWLYQSVNPNVVAGGFSSRCLFVVSDKSKRRIAWPSGNTRTDGLVHRLSIIREEVRRFKRITLDTPAMKAFTNWYLRRTTSVDPFTASFESREADHVLRIAGLLSVNDQKYVISVDNIRDAIRLVTDCKVSGSKLFEGTTARTTYVLGVTKIRETLISAGADGIGRARLYNSVRGRLSNSEFDAVIEVMHELGALQQFEIKLGPGRPSTLYRGTKLLASKKFTKTVLDRMA